VSINPKQFSLLVIECLELSVKLSIFIIWDEAYDGVINVYTYDWTDEEDVMRVRAALRRLGFKGKLTYKSDEDTRARKYHDRTLGETANPFRKYYC